MPNIQTEYQANEWVNLFQSHEGGRLNMDLTYTGMWQATFSLQSKERMV